MTAHAPVEAPESERAPRWHVPLLVLLGLPVFFLQLGSYSVVNGDEGIYHAIAVHMVETGDWTHLDYHGQHRVYDTFMNAPVQYWVRAALISALGDGLWAMRLASALFGLLTVLGTYALVARIARSGEGRWRCALFAGLVQLTSFQFVYLHGARTGELDAVVSFLLVAVALGFLRGVSDGRSFLPHHAALALLFTVKAPIVLVPIAAELAFFALTRPARARLGAFVRSALVVLPLGVAWHAVQAVSLWDEFRAVATKMSGEAGGSVGGGPYSGGPLENLAWYARTTLAGLFPWSLAVVPAAVALALRAKDEDEREGWRLAALLAAAVWAFFALVSKRFPWYVMPSFPLAAAAVGAWLGRPRAGARGAVLLALVAAGAAALALPAGAPHPLVDRAARYPLEVLLRPEAAWAVPAAFVAALAVGLLWERRERALDLPALAFVLLFAAAAVRVARPLGGLEHESDLARLAARVEADRAAGRPVRYPIAIPETEGWLRVQYYFGRDHLVVARGGRILVQGAKPGRRPGGE